MAMPTTGTRSPSKGAQVQAEVEGVSPDQIKTLRLSDGDHQVSDCRIVHFAMGEAQSPIKPAKLYPYLRYRDELTGQEFWTPWSAILGLSADEPSSSSRSAGQRI